MSEFIVTIFRLLLLLFLFLFVLFIIFAVRGDIYGVNTSITPYKSSASESKAEEIGKNEPVELFVKSGSLQGTIIPLSRSETIKIGRADNSTIVIDDQYTSNDHAEIFYENKKWFIQDIGSTNGTFVNGEKVDTIEILKGDSLQIGSATFSVR